MSSRANASARNRRAGGAELNPPQPQQRGQQPQQRGQQPQRGEQQGQTQLPKLSISDAIGLITLRLGKVEGMVQNIQVDHLRQGDSGMELNENSRIIDDNVFKSIVSRLDVLEKNQKALMDNQTTLSNSMKTIASRAIGSGGESSTQTIINDVSDEKLVVVNESIDVVRREITSVKEMLMKLQNFSMETNQRLMDFVFEKKQQVNDTVHNTAFIVDHDETDLDLDEEESEEISEN